MSMVVNNNMMAANTARNLNAHYGRLATSTQRLSSGLRVNSAADDAAGLAIRELQRADIAALHQGARNANDAISMIQVADGSLGVIDEKLIRLKELAEQAATGTYDSTQRMMIESEYQAMAAEITRIANSTDFNGIKLLDGTLSGEHVGTGLTSTGKMKIHFGTGNDSAEDYYYVTIGDCTAGALGVGKDAFVRNDKGYFENENGQVLLVTVEFEDNGDIKSKTLSWGTEDDDIEKDEVFRATVNDINDYLKSGNGNGQVMEEGKGKTYETAFHAMKDKDKIIGQLQIKDGNTVSTQEAAQNALEAINDAIVSKDKIRAHLGAMQNRLENTVSNLNIQAENLQAAESRISDVDVATEMTQFVRNQILTQSAVAMLSQANSLPQMAMQLIGG